MTWAMRLCLAIILAAALATAGGVWYSNVNDARRFHAQQRCDYLEQHWVDAIIADPAGRGKAMMDEIAALHCSFAGATS